MWTKGDAAAADMVGDVEVRRLDLQELAVSVRDFAEGSLWSTSRSATPASWRFRVRADGRKTGSRSDRHQPPRPLRADQSVCCPRSPIACDRVPDDALTGVISLRDLNWKAQPYSAWLAYGQSKLANLLFTSELQRRLSAAGSAVRRTPPTPATRPPTCKVTPETGSGTPVWNAGNRCSPPARSSAPIPPVRGRPKTCRRTASSARSSGRAARSGPVGRAARWRAQRRHRPELGGSPRNSRKSDFRCKGTSDFRCRWPVGYPWSRVTAGWSVHTVIGEAFRGLGFPGAHAPSSCRYHR